MTRHNGELYVGERKLSELAKTYQTPLYVYDETGILDKIRIFETFFTSQKFACEVIYASKAFLAPRLCHILNDHRFGIDAVSAGDLHLIEKSGFDPHRIVLHGNNKSDEELELGVAMGVEYLVVDNYPELIKLKHLSETKKTVVHTLFRVNPGINAHTHAYIETALLSSKFGESIYDGAMMEKISKTYQESPYLVLDGFHAHIGSQINNPNSFTKEAKTMMAFIRKFQDAQPIPIRVLNLGGGFGIKYLDDDQEINLENMLGKTVKTVESLCKKYEIKLEKLLIEPGRSLVGDSGFTLYRCGGNKQTVGGKNYLFIDGGMADNIRPALYQAKYTVEIANRADSTIKKDTKIYDVVGKCCESGDIIAKDIPIPEAQDGDTVVVYSTGAYCYSMSMNYNGLVRGAVIFVNGKDAFIAINRESYDHLIETCHF